MGISKHDSEVRRQLKESRKQTKCKDTEEKNYFLWAIAMKTKPEEH